jgi:hypothetical protein
MQMPPMQLSVTLQQRTSEEQLWLVSAQAAAARHVPLVAPAGTSQARPSQQSELTVQVAPDAWQKDVAVLFPQVQLRSPTGQVLPAALVQTPLQQLVVVSAVQLPVSSLQLADQLEGRQAKKLFLSSYDWQVNPASSQQLVSVRSEQVEPSGLHVGVPPPHLRTPLASGTHASPLQH